MKTLIFKTLIALFIITPQLLLAQKNSDGEYEKRFHQEYPVDKSCKFDIDNSFGAIVIDNVNTDMITIDAVIIVKTNSEDKAERAFNKITITIGKEGNIVSAKTDVNNINNTDFEINYHVSMPSYLNLDLKNRYGAVTIDELLGKNNIDIKYGSLKANRIMDNNEKPLTTIELGYCDHSEINEFNWGNLVMRYSNINIEKGKAMAISSQYSELRLGYFSSLVIKSSYDNYKINEIKNLVVNTKYTDLEINQVNKVLNVVLEYGELSVSEIPQGFETVEVDGKYSDINLGISNEASYNLNARVKYADIKYPELKNKEKTKDDFEIEVSGSTGNESATATVKVTSEYGDVDLMK